MSAAYDLPCRPSGALRKLVAGAAATVVLCASAGAASADGNARTGGWLARHWCGGCHAAGGDTASDAAPPLENIARRTDLPQGWLRAWLANPHPPMPNLQLSKSEIDDIVAYLESLTAR